MPICLCLYVFVPDSYMTVFLYACMPVCLYAYMHIYAHTIKEEESENDVIHTCARETFKVAHGPCQVWLLLSHPPYPYLYAYMPTYLYVYVPIFLNAYMPIRLYACMPICLYSYMPICLYA